MNAFYKNIFLQLQCWVSNAAAADANHDTLSQLELPVFFANQHHHNTKYLSSRQGASVNGMTAKYNHNQHWEPLWEHIHDMADDDVPTRMSGITWRDICNVLRRPLYVGHFNKVLGTKLLGWLRTIIYQLLRLSNQPPWIWNQTVSLPSGGGSGLMDTFWLLSWSTSSSGKVFFENDAFSIFLAVAVNHTSIQC